LLFCIKIPPFHTLTNMNQNTVFPQAQRNAEYLKNTVLGSDVLFHEVSVGKTQGVIAFTDGLCDKELLGEQVLLPLTRITEFLGKESLSLLACPEVKTYQDFPALTEALLGGDAVLFMDGFTVGYAFGCRKYPARAVNEPPTSVVVKGPREGFVEDMKTNLALIRKRLRSPALTFTGASVGKYSKTPVTVVYLSGVADEKLAKRIVKRINKIQIDGVPDSSYVAKFLQENPGSLIKQVGQTEKPDVFSAKLLEGRIGVLVEGSPIALTLPFLILEDFQNPEDYYHSSYRSAFSRILRIFGVALSILLPASYVGAQLFQLQLIPLKFLVTIVNSIKEIPFSPSLEMLVLLLVFEILSEASIRMPKYIGMALSVVGAIVLGETAIHAGLVSTPAVLIMAVSGICTYTVPDLVGVTTVLRFSALIIAGTGGVYALSVGMAVFFIYLSSLESFGVPQLAPYSPRLSPDLTDGFIKHPFFTGVKRPLSLKSKNRTRMQPPRRK